MASPTILIVESDGHLRELISIVLSDEGYLVITAVDGATALRLLQGSGTAPPAAIVLGGRLADMPGARFAQEYRSVAAAPVPIVFMSAADAERVAGQIGAAGWLAKPFDIQELVAVVARIVPAPGDPAAEMV